MVELSRGYIDEDEDAESTPTDRAYWEKRGSKATVALADQLLVLVKGLDPSLELKYNKFYIGLSKEGQPYNFVSFRPKKNQLNFELKLPQSDSLDAKIEEAAGDAGIQQEMGSIPTAPYAGRYQDKGRGVEGTHQDCL